MNSLLIICYEFVVEIFPFILALIYFRILPKHQSVKRRYLLPAITFALYLIGVFHFTQAGTLCELRRFGIKIYSSQINTLPFSREIDVVTYLQNILLFIPLGFLLPLLWTETNKLAYIALFGFSLSALIEISQLFNNRRSDIDDLILNTTGALIGCLLFRCLSYFSKWSGKAVGNYRVEPIVYVAAIFLGRFLFFDELGIAKLLYDF